MAASRRTRNTLAARKLRKGAETIRGIVSARGTLARGSPAAFAKKCGGKLSGTPGILRTESPLRYREKLLRDHSLSARGPAKAFRRSIHWMDRLLCLLTFPGERFAFLFYGGLPPRPHSL